MKWRIWVLFIFAGAGFILTSIIYLFKIEYFISILFLVSGALNFTLGVSFLRKSNKANNSE
ncbi:hypothetical protein [Clostridium thermarum]|uniref:hypothetical protein n=1 Tax=Clostridium thermarum TaxID=1716543 RepID=UPI00111F3D87|nr:hypothetical protein [Clostridium thermarum]